VQAIGQDPDAGIGQRYIDAPPPRQRGEDPKQRAHRAHHAAVAALHDAEHEVSSAGWDYAQAAAAVALGDATEADFEAAEVRLVDAERAVRRWQAAVRDLERRMGRIRDPAGNLLQH
jgi:hypothetical protein